MLNALIVLMTGNLWEVAYISALDISPSHLTFTYTLCANAVKCCQSRFVADADDILTYSQYPGPYLFCGHGCDQPPQMTAVRAGDHSEGRHAGLNFRLVHGDALTKSESS